MRLLTHQTLAWAGALPFVFCATCIVAGIGEVPLFRSGLLDRRYWLMRRSVTTVVIVALLTMAALA